MLIFGAGILHITLCTGIAKNPAIIMPVVGPIDVKHTANVLYWVGISFEIRWYALT